jgi:quercetin dioxygenase-like cupin family protein
MSGYEVAKLDEIERRETWIPIRERLGIAAFGINAFRVDDAGADVISDHTEVLAEHEELYVVVEGHATFTVDGEAIDAPAGSLVFVPDPRTRRRAVAKVPGTTALVVGGKPGMPFEVSAWEETWRESREAMGLYREQRYAEAADVLREAIERHPRSAGLYYNLACFESLAGADVGSVAGHLRKSIELYPHFRQLAQDDSDFDPVRNEAAFEDVVAV